MKLFAKKPTVKGVPPNSYLASALSHRTLHHRQDRSVLQSKSAARKETLDEASEVCISIFLPCICTNAVTAGLTCLSDSADIEREVLVLKREEQKLIREIKQTAAKGNTAGAKQLAKSLIRLRGQEAKLQASVGQLRGVKTSIAVCASANLIHPSSHSMSGISFTQQTHPACSIRRRWSSKRNSLFSRT
jgi:hypothetical protein